MGLEQDPGPSNPYADQTTANRDAPWLGSGTPVDVDLDGLREYAKHMVDQQRDLIGRTMHLNHLTEMPHDAWSEDVLGEAHYVRSQFSANAKELSIYLQQLGQTLQNIGHAAQTVADSYGSADGTSAATLNSVLFAFGAPGATRPSGLPPQIGQTYQQATAAQASEQAVAADDGQWGRPVTTTSPYQTTVTSEHPNGQRMEVVTTSIPGSGGTVVTTTIYAGDRVLSTTRENRTYAYDQDTNTATTTTETTQNGERTGRTVENTTYEYGGGVVNETTTSYAPDAQGVDQERSTREQTVGEDGVRTDTTSRPDRDDPGEREVIDRVVTGPQTEGPGTTTGESVAAEYTPPLPGS